MRCSKAQNLISLAMDQSLAPPEGVALEGHLRDCPGCVRYREDLLRCRELLQESEMAPSASFEWKVQLGIQKALREGAAARQEKKSRPFWLPAGLSAALTAALVLAAGLAWIGSGGPSVAPDGTDAGGVEAPASSPVARATSPQRFQGEDWLLDRSGRLAGPDGETVRTGPRMPASLQGRVTTVRERHIGPPSTVDLGQRFRYERSRPGPIAGAADSVTTGSAPVGR